MCQQRYTRQKQAVWRSGLCEPMRQTTAELFAAALPEIERRRGQQQHAKPTRKRKAGGGRKRLLKPYQQVLLTLKDSTKIFSPRMKDIDAFCLLVYTEEAHSSLRGEMCRL